MGFLTIHAALTPQGKVFAWDFWGARTWDPAVLNDADPANDGQNQFHNPPANYLTGGSDLLFCAGHSWLKDGRLLVTGGQGEQGEGSRHAAIWNPATKAWAAVPDMNAPRWYPTNTTLPDGQVLVIAGRQITGTDPLTGNPVYGNNPLPQVYNPTTNAWRDLSAASREVPLYPFNFVAPDGRVFVAGPQQQSSFLDTAAAGAWSNGPTSGYGYRDYGTAVMYRPGKIMIAGGSDDEVLQGSPVAVYDADPTPTAEVIDLNQAAPAWQPVDPMHVGRRHLTATILPDGTVFVAGGSKAKGFNTAYREQPDGTTTDESVYTPEIWNPDAPAGSQWTTLNPMAERRLYHHAVVLLPDGRLLVGGGGSPSGELLRLDGTSDRNAGVDADHKTAEIYSPPYLFKGARPQITAAPDRMAYGGSFKITSTQQADVQKVTLVKTAAVTHGFNMDQRFDALAFTRNADGTITVRSPADANRMPPGHYMLFTVNGQGVPSVAKILRLDATAAAVVGVLSDSPDPVTAGTLLTLTATSVSDGGDGGGIATVEFFRESNGQPGFQPGDVLINADTNGTDGWTATAPTSGLSAGTYTYYARAVNAFGVTGTAAVTTSTVTVTPPPDTGPVKLTGAPIGTAGAYGGGANTKERALDGSLSTFFDAPVSAGAWVGLDLGAARAVTQVRFAPRSSYPGRMVGGKFQAS
ncbi:MAG TPA: galactose oxidase-like domain-containing protein, partial [Tepidisphaeraceae bacterium]|nr:galactose oxidase-like domain-containing protein [Tepidisphaeraceae bacterium]